jgi:hypothetical protein
MMVPATKRPNIALTRLSAEVVGHGVVLISAGRGSPTPGKLQVSWRIWIRWRKDGEGW